MSRSVFRACGLALGAMLTVTAVACGGGSSSTSSGGFTGTVNVGISTTLTGSAAALGKGGLQGVQLAVDDLNQSGGVLNKKINLVSADDGLQPATGATNVRNMLLNDKVQALFGPVIGTAAGPEAQIAQQNRIPIFFQTANDITLTTSAYTPFSFEMVDNSYMIPNGIAAYLAKQPYHRYATISPDYSFGHNLVDAFIKSMKSSGADITVVRQEWPKLGTNDFSSYISAILAAKPDAVFIGMYGGDELTFLKQAVGYNFFQQVHAAALWEEDVFAALKDGLPAGLITWDEAAPFGAGIGKVDDFAKRYHQKFGEWPVYASELGYDSVQAWAAGVKKASTFDGQKVSNALSGATVGTLAGSVSIRSCDHQAMRPLYLGTLTGSVDPTYGFPVLKSSIKVAAESTAMGCAQAQALQPKQ